MRATGFEFRHRFWFIFLLFWVAFSAYWIDHRSVASALARWLVPGEALSAIQAIFGLAAFLIGIAALGSGYADILSTPNSARAPGTMTRLIRD